MEILFCKAGLTNRLNCRTTYWKSILQIKPRLTRFRAIPRPWKSTFRTTIVQADSVFSIAECWGSLYISGLVTAVISVLLTGQQMYLFICWRYRGDLGTVELPGEGMLELIRECQAVREEVESQKKERHKCCLFLNLSLPLPLSPTLLLLSHSSSLHFKRKHATKMIMFFCTEH